MKISLTLVTDITDVLLHTSTASRHPITHTSRGPPVHLFRTQRGARVMLLKLHWSGTSLSPTLILGTY